MSTDPPADLRNCPDLTTSTAFADAVVVRDVPSNKRAATTDRSAPVSDDKRPRVVASLIHNIAPPRRARIGPQYQAEIPPWPPVNNQQPAGPTVSEHTDLTG